MVLSFIIVLSCFIHFPQLTPSQELSKHGLSGHWQQGLALFQEMCEQRVRSSVISFGAILSSCEKSGRWAELSSWTSFSGGKRLYFY